ncbi:disease resistance protein RPM1-like isoform X1 [Malus sylvestris]|uniref:disease resistance protein RPM1-like isoform X1 n=3 Tax=Malus sylvestris TaxID=3752 RepID=UPI0021ACDD7D|nr:disease resistance protein RPM1-like isoform X1 [Malus sylvestris]
MSHSIVSKHSNSQTLSFSLFQLSPSLPSLSLSTLAVSPFCASQRSRAPERGHPTGPSNLWLSSLSHTLFRPSLCARCTETQQEHHPHLPFLIDRGWSAETIRETCPLFPARRPSSLMKESNNNFYFFLLILYMSLRFRAFSLQHTRFQIRFLLQQYWLNEKKRIAYQVSKAKMESAASLLIGKIAAILENEASSIAAVRDEVDELKLELISMKSFLIDAEGKEPQTEGVKTWVTSVRNLTCDAENVIDEFLYHIYDKQSATPSAKLLHRTIYFPKNLWYRHRIAKKLQKITKKIKAIPERNERYGVSTIEGTSLDSVPRWVKNKAQSSLYIMEDELIGIEDKKQTLLGLLMNGEENEMVVSVVGMGGSGKTTLVANTFNNENVKRHFDCYAWITVSQTYVIEDLFKNLIKQFHQGRKEEVTEHLNSMSYEELLEMLSTYLKSKRYLIVLDDVWDIKLWQEIRIPLLNRHHGSRIMLTTRKKDIASYSFEVESCPLEIEPLENNEAWELFSKKAFSTYDNKSCPPELESLAWKLVEKCEGLPLAVVTLGGLMSSKRSSSEWRRVYNSLNWHLTNHPMLESMSSILLLSFNNLPNRLKPCFLYCALFPEDYLIRRKRLIKLWIAEGLVEPIDGVTPEEVAEDYLMELTGRSMLQVELRNEAGRPKACKMHDLMRELALSTSKKEKFGATYVSRDIVDKAEIRRLSIQTAEGEINSCTGMSELRSFLVFGTLKKLPSGFKLLRVLDLEDAPIDRFPDELVYLFNLRYLNLKGTLIEELPESIGRLRNLQNLNIRDSKIKALPKAISKLVNLRHLTMYRYTNYHYGFMYVIGIKPASDLSNLQKLQVLQSVESEGKIIKVIRNMTQLTSLGITNVKASDEMDLCDSLQKLELLHYLFLMASDEEEFLRVNALRSPPPDLQKVYLAGKLEKVPLWFGSLYNLTRMQLYWSRLEEDLLPHIQALPNLERLELVNAYVGEKLCFSRGFIKLKHLLLGSFSVLNSIAIEKGAMPNLHVLDIGNCMGLKALPQGIEFLANVERLDLYSVPMQLIESVREAWIIQRYNIFLKSTCIMREKICGVMKAFLVFTQESSLRSTCETAVSSPLC